MADTRALAKAYARELSGQGKESVFVLCEDLWRSGMMEEGHIAAAWALTQKKHFATDDLGTFTHWIDAHVHNWAHCDDFCNNVLGAYLMKFPEQLPVLREWAVSKNRWVRRAAAVSLIVPARKGAFLEESLAIAGALLTDPDDLVQKGYGWLLKEQCKMNEDAVFAFVCRHKARMPRTALRYAIEKMPEARKREAMAR
ncbi:DNA alkylation repair protein [Flaviaesturariibacter amylovorans]|uniref:DNA alkylation repair protein n=2 Tax=Flaviaesturariibacter amylovorans TaxID=1084520 RepID=A0ABP8HEZ9_9BACT